MVRLSDRCHLSRSGDALTRRQDVRGFVQPEPIWLNTPLRLEQIRARVSVMEVETRRFYEQSAPRAQDASIRHLLDDLAAEQSAHVERAAEPACWHSLPEF